MWLWLPNCIGCRPLYNLSPCLFISHRADKQSTDLTHFNEIPHPIPEPPQDIRADSRFVPCQWETALLCNDVSHWLGASLESTLRHSGICGWPWNLPKQNIMEWCQMNVMGSQPTQQLDSTFNSWFKLTTKKISKLCIFCDGKSPVTSWFPSQRASNVGSVSMSPRLHDKLSYHTRYLIRQFQSLEMMSACSRVKQSLL